MQTVPNAAPPITLADLLQAQQQQNLLLQQQLMLLQEKHTSSQHYSDPFEVLNAVDPDLKPLLIEWMKEYKSTLQHSVTQSDLQQKYLDIEKAGELQRSFADEANKDWQWPQSFKAQAKQLVECNPVLPEGGEDRFAMQQEGQPPFDICEAYKVLRRKHARECQDFIVAYQRQCASFYSEQASKDVQLQKLSDKLKTWFERYDGIFSSSVKASMEGHARTFAELTFRKELPKTRAKQEQDRAQKAKQKEALLQAESEFRLMDINKLLTMAVLEFASSPSKSTSAMQKKVSSTSALGFLIKQYPDIAEKHNLTIRKPDSRPSADPKRYSSRGSRKSGASGSRGRSTSQRASSKNSRTSSKASSKGSRKSSKGAWSW